MLLNESFMQGGKIVFPVYYLGYTQDMQSMDIFLYKIHVIYNFFSTSESKRHFAGIDC